MYLFLSLLVICVIYFSDCHVYEFP